MFYEGVVLLGSALRQRLEPVRIVCHAILRSPLLHAGSNSVSYVTFQTCTVVDDINHLFIDILWKIFIHLLTVEHLATVILRRSLTWCFYCERLLLERLSYYLKS